MRGLFIEHKWSSLNEDAKRAFLKGWYSNTFEIKQGDHARYAYLEVSVKETDTMWALGRDTFTMPFTWGMGSLASNAGVSLNIVDLLCESTADTIFTEFQKSLPMLPGSIDSPFSFSAVGNTYIMAIRCTDPFDPLGEGSGAPECADDDEVIFARPSLNLTHIGCFMIGVFLVTQALELSKQEEVFYVGCVSFFFITFLLLITWQLKNQGTVAKYAAAALGMVGIAMSTVIRKNTTIIFSVILKYEYLAIGICGLFVLAVGLSMYWGGGMKTTTRDRISDLMLTVLGICIMSAYEPYPWSGAGVGVALAVAVHLQILLRAASGVVLRVLQSAASGLGFLQHVFLYPFKPIIFIFKIVWRLLWWLFGIAPKANPDIELVTPIQSTQEYVTDGAVTTAMEVESLRYHQIEPNTRAYRRTRHVEDGADNVGALSPARQMRSGTTRYDYIGRSRGTTPQAAREWEQKKDTFKASHELGDDDITEEELAAEMGKYDKLEKFDWQN